MFWGVCLNTGLSFVATVVFSVRLLHAVVFSNKLPWFEPTKLITLKTQTHAANARWKRLSQLSLKECLKVWMIGQTWLPQGCFRNALTDLHRNDQWQKSPGVAGTGCNDWDPNSRVRFESNLYFRWSWFAGVKLKNFLRIIFSLFTRKMQRQIVLKVNQFWAQS